MRQKAPDYELEPLDLHGAFPRRADLSDGSLQNANFARADFTNANFKGADMEDANLEGTILNGADLREVDNLRPEQLAAAIIDERTRLPSYLEWDGHTIRFVARPPS